MKKGTIIGTIIFLVLSAGLYMVLTNSHADFFPGTSFEHNWETGQVDHVDGMVSLMYVDRGDAELNAAGWILAAVVIIIVPLLIGWFVARSMNRKAELKQTA
jgi:ABC-type antimicrobial peptide transport system permease subunit